MSIEYVIEVGVWVIGIALLYIAAVPKKKYREAQVSFLIMQAITWLCGCVVVELRLIEYPIRFFSYSTRTNFTFEYFAFPVISVLFNLYFPGEKVWLKKVLYAISFSSVLTVTEAIFEQYTDTIHYIHWNWFLSWFTMLMALYLSYIYYRWFFSIYTAP